MTQLRDRQRSPAFLVKVLVLHALTATVFFWCVFQDVANDGIWRFAAGLLAYPLVGTLKLAYDEARALSAD